jgi:hypothetical protein
MDLSSLPQQDDRLFQSSPVSMPRNPQGSWLAYAKAYKSAADNLVSEHRKSAREADAYPIIYLYRHYLELELKSIIALGCVAESVEEQDDDARTRVQEILRTHDLSILCNACWDACIRALDVNDEFLEIFVAFENCVLELASHDPGSFAFRYPIDKKLNPNLTKLQGVDLRQLKTIIDKMARFVAVIRHGLEQQIEYLDEGITWTRDDYLCHVKDVTGQDEAEAETESGEE